MRKEIIVQKSLLEKFMDLFRKQNTVGGSKLSAAKAIDMQKSYATAGCIADFPLSAPYPEIIRQLYSAKTEIVEAALYYLHRIALNESEQTENILKDLERLLSAKNNISAKHRELIAQTIAIINNIHKV